MKLKKGDTLIEVALAIGIFSMVAITVVSVTTASTTAAQSSLEVTLTREEIDAQAEALRFIHNAYLAGSQSKDTSQNTYKALWKAITDRTTVGAPKQNFNTLATCNTLYANKGDRTSNRLASNTYVGTKLPFIINTRQLSTNNPNKIIIKNPTSNSKLFVPAETYPRILYGGQTAAAAQNFYTQTEEGNNNIARIEGLFIVGYKSTANTKIVDYDNKENKLKIANQAAYYDFYIRACWMPPGATKASTISTVVRLSDPDLITH